MSKLKIIDIKLIRCGRLSFFKVFTNEEEITGIGECIVNYEPILKGYTEFLRDFLIGEDPFNTEKIWKKLYTNTFFLVKKQCLAPLTMHYGILKGKN